MCYDAWPSFEIAVFLICSFGRKKKKVSLSFKNVSFTFKLAFNKKRD